jgi:hypothetical protein
MSCCYYFTFQAGFRNAKIDCRKAVQQAKSKFKDNSDIQKFGQQMLTFLDGL